MKRIAVVYDDRLRSDTTGVYCLAALRELCVRERVGDVAHVLPDDLPSTVRHDFDLFLFIDDGIIQSVPDHLRPAVFWAIDTHVDFERVLGVASLCDLAFAAQKRGVDQLAKSGIDRPSWLPLACDASSHGRRAVDNRYDVAFVGNLVGDRRRELVTSLQARFPRSFFGNADHRQMADIYSASKIVFNCSVADDVNMRVFEGLCSGALVLTNESDSSGLSELFAQGKHVATYRDDCELFEKIDFFLNSDDARREISAAGREAVLNGHTYTHRMSTLLTKVDLIPGDASPDQTGLDPKGQDVSATFEQAKGLSYFGHPRPEVVALVPDSATDVLDIGCGSGELGKSLKQRQTCRVVGVELVAEAAEVARTQLDQIVEADIADDQVSFSDGEFDCVIAADVLEHLRNPEQLLRRVSDWLQSGGTLVASIPNVRNHTVLRSLVKGNWTYESAGLLDDDHVRFFTRSEIEKLFFRCGYTITRLDRIFDQEFQNWSELGKPSELQFGTARLTMPSSEDAAELFTYQYLLTAKVDNSRIQDTTSIVIVTHNQLRYTRTCLDSLRRHTTVPIEIVVVDNASSDDTVAFLRSQEDVRLIANDENRGFPAAANQGMRHARGKHVVLLNNDTIVTTGWLRRMLDALERESDVGIVGPLSNKVSGEQQIEVDYDDLAQIDGFAWRMCMDHAGCTESTDRLVGFCMLIHRQVIDSVGFLDEQFGIGNFEDDDYCRRTSAAGFRCLIARDSFVHHFGSVSFRASEIDFAAVLAENQRKFERKWSTERRSTTESPVKPQGEIKVDGISLTVGESDRQMLQLRFAEPLLSACLIVRDNEDTIRDCLRSLIPWVDEVIVVDTGSIDATPEICESLGVIVHRWAWRDSFSAARNESLAHASGRWIFWMDSDDTLPPQCGARLRHLATTEHPDDLLGFVMQVHCPGDSNADVTVVDHVKLIRNRDDLRFEFCVHEQILPAIRRVGGRIEHTDVYVVHSGSDRTAEGRSRKFDRDMSLLKRDLEEHPDHPFVLFNLGMTLADANKHQEARSFLERCIEVSQDGESHLRKAYSLLVHSLQQLGMDVEARLLCDRALKLLGDDPELLFRSAILAHQAGELAESTETYHYLLSLNGSTYFKSLDSGIASFKSRFNLACVLQELDRTDEAIDSLIQAVSEAPAFIPAAELLKSLVLESQSAEVALNVAGRLQAVRNVELSTLVRGLHQEFNGDVSAARQTFQSILDSRYRQLALDSLCRVSFALGDLQSCIPHLEELAKASNGDGAIWHNLAVARLSSGATDAALEAARHSLKVRPGHTQTVDLVRQIVDSSTT